MNGHYEIGDVVLRNWRLTELIGNGSYGQVFAAQRDDFGTTYDAAIKIITIPQSRSEVDSILSEGMNNESVTTYFRGFVEEIVKESEMMSRLKGTANVVSYEDHEVVPHTDGVGWDIMIRMERLTPLLEYLQNTTVTRRDVIRLGIDLCKALELCQKHNIIHRDIKPENIFVSENGDYKLGDFGIARTVEKTTGGLSKKGTYTYMAPEVYKGLPYNSSVDIYSLGIVMYRLLNDNRTPFLPAYPAIITHSDRENAMAMRITGEQIPAPKYADERLARVILTACEYDPLNRYASPSLMRQDLEALERDPIGIGIESGAAAGGSRQTWNAPPAEGQGAVLASGAQQYAGQRSEDFASQPAVQQAYQIRFLNYDGTLLSSKNYAEGQYVEAPAVADVHASDGYTYEFSGWSPPLVEAANANADYVACFQQKAAATAAAVGGAAAAAGAHGTGKQPGGKKKKLLIPILGGAAVLVVLALALLLLPGKDKTPQQPVSTAPTVHSDNQANTPTENPKKESADKVTAPTAAPDTYTEPPAEALNWSDWMEKVPDSITAEDYVIEAADVFAYHDTARFGSDAYTLEQATAAARDRGMSYAYTLTGTWSEFSDWSLTRVEPSELVDVEEMIQYYYRSGTYVEVGDQYHTHTTKQYVLGPWQKVSGPVSGASANQQRSETLYRSRTRTLEFVFVSDKASGETFTSPIKAKDGSAVVKTVLYRYRDRTADDWTSAGMSNFDAMRANYSGLLADVDDSQWYGSDHTNCIGDAIALGAMSADSYMRFRPTENVTIAEVIKAAAIIRRCYHGNVGTIAPGSKLWYAPYVQYAAENGIIGINDFDGRYEEIATRAETAYILKNALPAEELMGENIVLAITDMDLSDPYYKSVYQLAQAGVISWTNPSAAFNPSNPITRAEIAIMIERITHPDTRVIS